VTAVTPGQAAYEAFRSAVPDWVCNVPAGPWDELSPAIQAGFDAIAAQEPSAAEVEAAFAGGMRVRTAPCTVEAHDREHFQVRTNGHWLCGHLLASVLAVQGIVADARPQPAPEMAAQPGLRVDWARVSEAVADRERERDEARAERDALRERAEAAEAAKRAAKGELADLENRLAQAIAAALMAERARIRELADRTGAVCTGDEGTSHYFSALLTEGPR
jgi:hypothetical protein